jgi:hypothetical protein
MLKLSMTIRSLVLFVCISLFTRQDIFAQNKLEKIHHIQDVFMAINKIPDLIIIKVPGEEFLENMTDGGAELTGFFKNDSLVKISEWVGLSYGAIEIDYYFEKGKLVFSYVKEKYFPVNDSTVDRTRLDLKFEGRYYYENDVIIAQKNSGSGMWGNTLDNLNPILENSKAYSKLLLSRKNK